MRILAAESTSAVAGVAICDGDRCLYEHTEAKGLTHSETLLPMVLKALADTDTKAEEIDLYTCTVGPGSFTGIRIAAAVIKGLAYGRGRPCVAVSTLMSLAENLKNKCGIVVPVMDARREQVYAAVFEARDGRVSRLCEDRAVGLDILTEELKEKYFERDIYLCGDGYDIAKKYLTEAGVCICDTDPQLILQSPASTAACALRLYNEGKYTSDKELCPTYLRAPQAERERLEKENLNK